VRKWHHCCELGIALQSRRGTPTTGHKTLNPVTQRKSVRPRLRINTATYPLCMYRWLQTLCLGLVASTPPRQGSLLLIWQSNPCRSDVLHYAIWEVGLD
jgi:hypothetical protein